MTLTETQSSAVSSLSVHALTPVIGAKIKGADLAHVDDAAVVAIRAALLEHKVLFFRGQDINQEDQVSFARRLGALTGGHPTLPSADGQGYILELDSLLGGRADHWHTDVTFALEPPAISVLRAVKVPPVGGDTQWASTEAAYALLPAPLKRLAGELHAVHTNGHDYAQPPIAHEDAEARKHRIGAAHRRVFAHVGGKRRGAASADGRSTRFQYTNRALADRRPDERAPPLEDAAAH